jgi:DNA-binding MarR family transcriptional regulator
VALQFLSPIHKASRQISLFLREEMKELGLDPGEGHLLSYLRRYGPCPIGELHRVFGYKRSTLTSMLDRLDARALTVRSVNPNDRRSVEVALTRKGRRAAERIQRLLEAFEGAVRRRIRAGDLDGFGKIMEAIAAVTGVELKERNKK